MTIPATRATRHAYGYYHSATTSRKPVELRTPVCVLKVRTAIYRLHRSCSPPSRLPPTLGRGVRVATTNPLAAEVPGGAKQWQATLLAAGKLATAVPRIQLQGVAIPASVSLTTRGR